MSEPTTTMMLASFGLLALSMVLFAGLKGWQGWLEIKRLELTGQARHEPRSQAADLIEMADLRERVRKLESIAACIDI